MIKKIYFIPISAQWVDWRNLAIKYLSPEENNKFQKILDALSEAEKYSASKAYEMIRELGDWEDIKALSKSLREKILFLSAAS